MRAETLIKVEVDAKLQLQCPLCKDYVPACDVAAWVLDPDLEFYYAWCFACARRVLRLALTQANIKINEGNDS